jgi:hypothetical protein
MLFLLVLLRLADGGTEPELVARSSARSIIESARISLWTL